MGRIAESSVDLNAAAAFLTSRFGNVTNVEWVGEGAWSRCFGFVHEGRDLVVKFGQHLDDFEKDRMASTWRSEHLPIPEMIDLGEAFDAYYAISTRAHGVPLETLDASGWQATTPSLLRSLDALRRVPVSSQTPFGARDFGHFATWPKYLIASLADSPRSRIHGWSERIRESAHATDAYALGSTRLEIVARDLNVAATVIHSDLVNRNVFVIDSSINAIFDWGCSFAGDFLYEIALITFWTPWYEGLGNFDLLGAAINHYESVGADLEKLDHRLEACALQIGLSHIAYNAYLRDWTTLDRTADRMLSLTKA